jgi:branched-subunit amino acid aminotransferase/4-amino-4-deoxychorismate lyase
MLEIDWDLKNGWHDPKIIPYQNLSLSPASTALHYGIEVKNISIMFLNSITNQNISINI